MQEPPAHDDAHGTTATLTVPARPQPERARSKRDQPKLWNVILLDDDHHSYEYVMRMLMELFHKSIESAFEMAKEVDTTGRVICTTAHKELAELKQEQIHAYGKDRLIASCAGAMSATIEPVA